VSDARLSRGREEIEAARALLEAGFPSQALSRAYFACFHAASATLEAVGDVPVTHTGVVSAFARHAVAQDGVGHEAGRILRRLFEHRGDVDYGLSDAPASTARAAIEDAERLIAVTERWIAERSSQRDGRRRQAIRRSSPASAPSARG
jgi:uncharacterized protein (UPF0332 family)